MRRVFPLERYTALYDGRLLHAYDSAYQRYLGGEGPTQRWERLDMNGKRLVPRVFVNRLEAGVTGSGVRIGFRDIARGTDERTLIASAVGPSETCGNTIPILTVDAARLPALLAVLNSFVADFVLRLRAGAHVNWVQAAALVVPRADSIVHRARSARPPLRAARRHALSSPELLSFGAGARTWQVAGGPPGRQTRRRDATAEIDAEVATRTASVPEFAYVLSTFPLLDRDQPALPGDAFVTDGGPRSRTGTRGVDWDETEDGIVELSPRSFVTRDLALFTYMKRKSFPIPDDLERFYRDQVGLDPRGAQSRFPHRQRPGSRGSRPGSGEGRRRGVCAERSRRRGRR
ncbi:MAG: hypothetical protein IPN34_27565 [Planctomycetes bacterium]|nr:hypothetical protein [Planctomycetota bacterium]